MTTDNNKYWLECVATRTHTPLLRIKIDKTSVAVSTAAEPCGPMSPLSDTYHVYIIHEKTCTNVFMTALFTLV